MVDKDKMAEMLGEVKPDKELEEIVDDATDELLESLTDEELEETIKEDCNVAITNEAIYDLLLKVQSSVNDVDKHVTNRKEENINVLKMIFERLKRITTRIGKWYIGILVIAFICGGVVFTSIYHNWEVLEPKIDKILGLAKIGNQTSNIIK